MIKGVVERLPELPDEAFVSARQENLETIHQHNVSPSASARSGEIRERARVPGSRRRLTRV